MSLANNNNNRQNYNSNPQMVANNQFGQGNTLETQFSVNNPSAIYPDRVSERRIPERSNNNNQYNSNDVYQSDYIQNYNQNNAFNDYQRKSHNPYDSPQQQQQSLNVKQQKPGNSNGQVNNRNNQAASQRVSAAPNRQEQINSAAIEYTQYIDHVGDITPIEADRPSYAYSPNPVINQQNMQFEPAYDEKVKKTTNQANVRQINNPQQQIQEIIAKPQLNPMIPQNLSPVKKHMKIFDTPKSSRQTNNNNFILGQNISPNNNNNNMYPQRQKGVEEMMMYGPSDINKTVMILPEENLTIMHDQQYISPNNNVMYNSPNSNILYNAPNNYIQEDKVKKNANFRQPLDQSNMQNTQQFQSEFLQNSKIGRHPPIIAHFKNKNINLEQELDLLFRTTSSQNITIHLINLKRIVDEKIEICMDSINQIKSEKSDLLDSYDQIYFDYLENQHIFSSAQINQYQTNVEKMEKAIEQLKAQKGVIDSNQNRAKKQVLQCAPEMIQQPIIQQLILDNWLSSTLEVLNKLKYPLNDVFSDTNITCINVAGMQSVLNKISYSNGEKRLQLLKEQAYQNKSQDMDRLYSLLIHLMQCDRNLNQISYEIDSAVLRYSEFLTKLDQQLIAVGGNLNVYMRVLSTSIVSLKELHEYANNQMMFVQDTLDISNSLFEKTEFPFDQHIQHNKQFLKSLDERRNQQIINIIQYISYIRDKQNQIHLLQKKENLPFILQTPYDWEVIGLSQQADQCKKRLEVLESVIKSLLTMEFTSTRPMLYYKNVQDWINASQKRIPTPEASKNKVEEIQRYIIELIGLRDSLGMHHVKYSYPNFFKPIYEEYEKVSGIIIQIQNLQAEISKNIKMPIYTKGDPQFTQAGIQSQNQISSMNQIMHGGSYNALPQLQTEENVKKSSNQSPNKSQHSPHKNNEIERFNYEVTQTRHLLQSNVQRQKPY